MTRSDHTSLSMSSIHLSILCLFVVIYPVQLVNPSCSGKYNTNPIVRDEPTFVTSIPNGKRFVVGSDYDKINIVHVYGTPYDMGYAFGKLMSKDLLELLPIYNAYLEQTIEDIIKIVPKFISQWIADLGLTGALDLNYDITRGYTPPWYEEELQGIADGSGASVEQYRRMNLIPELIKAACTVLGAYGESTLSSKLLHLRSLDWDAKAPIASFATVTVYHPNASYPGYAENFHKYYKQQNYTSHAFANFGYPGLIGSLNAYSEASVSLGEKVWISKETDITSRFGNPWTYVLRDVVQFADSIDTALTMMVNAKRTCSIHLGLGSYTRNTNTSMINDEIVGFRGIEYSANELNVFDWQDMFNTPAHPQLKNIVYWDKHVQPSGNPCLGSLLVEAYGRLDAPTIIQNITSLSESGDALNLVFDFGENAAYIAYSAPDDPKGPLEAYNRAHTRLDMAKLFAEPAPK